MKDLEQYKKRGLVYTSDEEMVHNELYETQITEIVITPDMFHNISGSLYPKKGLTNDIGSACGIEFTSSVKMEDVYGDMIIQPDGTKIQKVEGVRCIKQGKRRRPDGSWQLSSPCSYSFNWQDRADFDFLNAEDKGYKTYDTELKKKKHIMELKKFADQRASTGAQLMVIRELVGMPTGFKQSELNGKTMVFSQIAKSTEYQKAIASATIDNIRSGGDTAKKIEAIAGELTGETIDTKENFEEVFDRPEPAPKAENKEQTLRDQFDGMLKSEKVPADARAHYEITAKDNGYSDDVLNFCINDMKPLLED